ncbi:MAG TPA: cytochrome P450 [Micromonosporaceae bacterium]|nr:cytochrome P450 [Micromonosporaceae bacterium]
MHDAVSLKAIQSADGRRDPYAHYARLHTRGTASPLDRVRDGYDVIVFGYETADRVLKDPAFRLMDTEYMDGAVARWREHTVLRVLKDSVFFVNGSVHTRMRRLFHQAFTPRRVTSLEPAIARITDDLLDRIAELGAGGAPVDFMAEFAFPLPSNVIGELLGVPEEDRAWFRPRVRALSEIFELDGSTWSSMRAADEATAELREYFAELAAKRRADPRDDLVSALVAARAEDDQRLTDDELLANLIALFNAGFVTTTHMFGCGLTLLLARPQALAALLADAELASGYVEEILRYEPPTHFLIRYATVDTEIDGVPVPRGSSVVIALGAANRDPRRFPQPDVFDPRRADNRPLSFGAGPHFCLGAALTRIEGQVAFPRLLRRFPALALQGDPGPPTKLQFRGYETLAVTTESSR